MQRIILLLLLVLLLTACQSPIKAELSPITISEAYPGNLTDVTMIELIDGSSGERRQLTSKNEIDSLLNDIKDLVLEPDHNQEGRTGYVYRLALYEEGELKMEFLPTVIDRIYYTMNDQLLNILKKLYSEQFNKQY